MSDLQQVLSRHIFSYLEAILNEEVPFNTDERVIRLRQRHRRAYAARTPEADDVLIRLYAAGFEVDDLIGTLCHQEGAIRSRLKRLASENSLPATPAPEMGLLRVTPDMAAQSFPAWLGVVTAGGRVEIWQGGKAVALLIAAE